MTDFLLENLLNGERNFFDLDLAVAIVNLQLTGRLLLRRKDVLAELGGKAGRALGAASPRFDLGRLLDHVVGLKSDGLLTDDEHSLVLHVFALTVKHSFGEVLDLGLWFLSVALFRFEEERGGDMIRKLEAERDSVVTWCDLRRRLPDILLVVHELFVMLTLLLLLNDRSCFPILLNLSPEANKTILATSFDLQTDALGVHDWRDDAHVDGA